MSVHGGGDSGSVPEADMSASCGVPELGALTIETATRGQTSGDEASPDSRQAFSPLWSSDGSAVMACDQPAGRVRVRLFEDDTDLSDSGPPAMQLRPLTPCDDGGAVAAHFHPMQCSPQSRMSSQDGASEPQLAVVEGSRSQAGSAFRSVSADGAFRPLYLYGEGVGHDKVDQWETAQSENAEADQFMGLEEAGGATAAAAGRPPASLPDLAAQAAFKLQDMCPGDWKPEDDQFGAAAAPPSDDERGATAESEMAPRSPPPADHPLLPPGFDDSLEDAAAGSECSFRDNPEGENLVGESGSGGVQPAAPPERRPDGSAGAPPPTLAPPRLHVNRTGADGEDWRPLPRMGAALRRPPSKARQADGASEIKQVRQPRPDTGFTPIATQAAADVAAGGDRAQRAPGGVELSHQAAGQAAVRRQDSPTERRLCNEAQGMTGRQHGLVDISPSRRQGDVERLPSRRHHDRADSKLTRRQHGANENLSARWQQSRADSPPERRHHSHMDSPPILRQQIHAERRAPERRHQNRLDSPPPLRQQSRGDSPSARQPGRRHHSPTTRRHQNHADSPLAERRHPVPVDSPPMLLLGRPADSSPGGFHFDPSVSAGLSPGNTDRSTLVSSTAADRYKDVSDVMSNDIGNMEQVRGHLQTMLQMKTSKGPLSDGAGYKDSVLLPFGEDEDRPSDIESAMSFPDFARQDASQPSFDSLLNYSSKYFVSGSGRSQQQQQQHAGMNLLSDNQMLRDHLEREKYRRKHCESQIHLLQNKLLETQQQLAVSVSTDHKKDAMIEQLDKTLARVVEGWKVREAEKQQLIGQLRNDNEATRDDQRLQHQSLQHFEKELAQTVEKLAGEQQRSLEAETTCKLMLEEQQRGYAQLSQQLETSHERQQMLQDECDSQKEARGRLERRLVDDQQTHDDERDAWEEKEGDYIQKIDGVSSNHIEVMEQMMAKCDRQLKTIHDHQTQLSSNNRELQDIRAELETTIRERESLKVQMGLLENRMEGNMHKMLADMRAKMEKKVNATLEEAKWTEAQLEQQLLERHRTEIQETNRRNSDEIEKQLALYRRDLARREEMIQQKDADSQEKMDHLQQLIEKMKLQNQRLEDDRQELTNRLQSMMQSHCNETLRLLQLGSEALIHPARAGGSVALSLQQPIDPPAVRSAVSETSIAAPPADQICAPFVTLVAAPPADDAPLSSATNGSVAPPGDAAAGGDAGASADTRSVFGPYLPPQPVPVPVAIADASHADITHSEGASAVGSSRRGEGGRPVPLVQGTPSALNVFTVSPAELLPEVQSSLECLVPRAPATQWRPLPAADDGRDATTRWAAAAGVTTADRKISSPAASEHSMIPERPLSVDYGAISDKFHQHQERQAELQHYIKMLLVRQASGAALSDAELEHEPVHDRQLPDVARQLPPQLPPHQLPPQLPLAQLPPHQLPSQLPSQLPPHQLPSQLPPQLLPHQLPSQQIPQQQQLAQFPQQQIPHQQLLPQQSLPHQSLPQQSLPQQSLPQPQLAWQQQYPGEPASRPYPSQAAASPLQPLQPDEAQQPQHLIEQQLQQMHQHHQQQQLLQQLLAQQQQLQQQQLQQASPPVRQTGGVGASSGHQAAELSHLLSLYREVEPALLSVRGGQHKGQAGAVQPPLAHMTDRYGGGGGGGGSQLLSSMSADSPCSPVSTPPSSRSGRGGQTRIPVKLDTLDTLDTSTQHARQSSQHAQQSEARSTGVHPSKSNNGAGLHRQAGPIKRHYSSKGGDRPTPQGGGGAPAGGAGALPSRSHSGKAIWK